MALDPIPTSSQSDGRWKITAVPKTANALSLAALNGGTAKSLTYGFTPDGFNVTITQATVNDPRLTLIQDLSRPGKKTVAIEVKYVKSTDSNSPSQVLTEGSEWKLNIRKGIANETAFATGQLADTVQILAGAQRPDAPTENGIDTISQTLYATDLYLPDGTLVA